MKRICELLYNYTANSIEELAKEVRGISRTGKVSNIQTFVDARIELIQEYLRAIDKLEK